MKGKPKSGFKAKAHKTRVLHEELYPHAVLDEDYMHGEIEFNDLSFNLQVAGEMEIISRKDISPAELKSREEILKKLAYYGETLDQKIILELYKSFITKIEKGVFEWGSPHTLDRIAQTLMFRTFAIESGKNKKVGKKKDRYNDNDRVYYCLDYYKGRCTFSDSHEGTLDGNTVQKLHICRVCLRKDKAKRNHPKLIMPVQISKTDQAQKKVSTA